MGDKLKMQKPVLLLLVLLLSQVLAKATPKTKIANLISRTSYNRASSVNTDLSSPSACTTTEIDDGSGTMSEVENVLYGISSALVPVVAEVASEVALEEYAVAVSAAYNLWGFFRGQDDDDSDEEIEYMNELTDCLKSWVSAEIDETLWGQATSAHSHFIVDLGHLYDALNETIDSNATDPDGIMKATQIYYDRMFEHVGTIAELFSGSQGGSQTVTVEMLQLNLDLLSLQAHAALTMLMYGAPYSNSIDDFDTVYVDKYMNDVEDFIQYQFGHQNDGLSLQYIFDNSPTVTEWPNSFEQQSQNCEQETADSWFGSSMFGCKHDTSWCKVYDSFTKKTWGECEEKCNTWGKCNEPCSYNSVCAPIETEALKTITNSLEATRNHIEEGKTLQQTILIQMKNLFGCDCDAEKTESCDLDTKKCTCRSNVTGDKCDTCFVDKDFDEMPSYCKSLLLGQEDVGGTCPSNTSPYHMGDGIDGCCCGNACCWSECRWDDPPEDCLSSVPNSEWAWNEELGYYQAVYIV